MLGKSNRNRKPGRCGIMNEEYFCYCHNDDTDEYHDCLDYMECEECPYYYADLD